MNLTAQLTSVMFLTTAKKPIYTTVTGKWYKSELLHPFCNHPITENRSGGGRGKAGRFPQGKQGFAMAGQAGGAEAGAVLSKKSPGKDKAPQLRATTLPQVCSQEVTSIITLNRLVSYLWNLAHNLLAYHSG